MRWKWRVTFPDFELNASAGVGKFLFLSISVLLTFWTSRARLFVWREQCLMALITITIIWLIHHRWCAAEHVIWPEIAASGAFGPIVRHCVGSGGSEGGSERRLMPLTCSHIRQWAWEQNQLTVCCLLVLMSKEANCGKTGVPVLCYICPITLHIVRCSSKTLNHWPCVQRITLLWLCACLLPLWYDQL